MSGFLLDTNVPSETLRRSPDTKVARWLSNESAKENQFISVITIGELRKGTSLLVPGARRTQLEQFIDNAIPLWFEERILSVTQAVAERWGVLGAQRYASGKPLATPDGLIAATALEHGLTLVTRNVRDFADLGIPLFNPWMAG